MPSISDAMKMSRIKTRQTNSLRPAYRKPLVCVYLFRVNSHFGACSEPQSQTVVKEPALYVLIHTADTLKCSIQLDNNGLYFVQMSMFVFTKLIYYQNLLKHLIWNTCQVQFKCCWPVILDNHDSQYTNPKECLNFFC